jgi:hypothetical protein
MIEIREVTKANIQSNLQHRFCGCSQSQGRFTQSSAQQELMRGETDDLPEGSQKVVGADPDDRA